MAEDRKGGMARLVALVVVLAAAGGAYFYMQSRPPKGGNLERIVNEDEANIIADHKTLDEVKKIFHHDSPDAGTEPGVYLFDFSKLDPKNKEKVEVVVKGGKVIAMRFLDERLPVPKPPLPGNPNAKEEPPETAPSGDQPAEAPKKTDGGG